MTQTPETCSTSNISGTEEAQAVNVERFGHHPDSAIDFTIEVETIENELLNHSLGFENGTPSMESLRARIKSAMMFVVGGDQGAVTAKARLRELEQDYCAAREWKGR